MVRQVFVVAAGWLEHPTFGQAPTSDRRRLFGAEAPTHQDGLAAQQIGAGQEFVSGHVPARTGRGLFRKAMGACLAS